MRTYLTLASNTDVISVDPVSKFPFRLLSESVVRVVQIFLGKRFRHPVVDLTTRRQRCYPALRRAAECCDESVCLSVSRITRPNATKFSTYVACGHGSVLSWRHRITLCTSGFVDNVIFPIVCPMAQATL